jgi:hypothetical protein
VDFFRVKLLGDGGVIRHVGKKDGDKFPLTLYRASGREALVCEVFRCVRLRLGVVNVRGFLRLPKVSGTVTAEFIVRKDFGPALRASEDEFRRTFPAELLVTRIIRLALRAFHPGASRVEDGWDRLGVLVLGSVLNYRKSR